MYVVGRFVLITLVVLLRPGGLAPRSQAPGCAVQWLLWWVYPRMCVGLVRLAHRLGAPVWAGDFAKGWLGAPMAPTRPLVARGAFLVAAMQVTAEGGLQARSAWRNAYVPTGVGRRAVLASTPNCDVLPSALLVQAGNAGGLRPW